jgi:DNA-binding response OmpR family regulator
VKKLILIIEDSEIIRSIIFEFLELKNFNVLSAEDGCIGLHLAKELQPDLILCDINMPKLDGYGVLKKLREDLSTATIPFIFLTAEADPDSRCRAMQLGANDYLTKPVNVSKLLNAIANQFTKIHSA